MQIFSAPLSTGLRRLTELSTEIDAMHGQSKTTGANPSQDWLPLHTIKTGPKGESTQMHYLDMALFVVTASESEFETTHITSQPSQSGGYCRIAAATCATILSV